MKVVGVMKRIFDWRVHGVRGVDVIGLVMVAALTFSVYLAKADAAGENAQIVGLERKIRGVGERVRILRAQVAQLESPARLEGLSRQAGLEPVSANRMADEDDLLSLGPRTRSVAPSESVSQAPDEGGVATGEVVAPAAPAAPAAGVAGGVR